MAAWSISEEVAIGASPEQVFDVLTDLERYADWNPWICEAKGAATEGNVVQVAAKLGGGKAMRVSHRILTSQRPRHFRWCDMGWFTAFAYGERARFLEPASGGARYRVELRITGIAAPLVSVVYGRALAAGLKAETEALKRRAESLA
jgi:uncharacterized protein YndB with AHSA1/START domain